MGMEARKQATSCQPVGQFGTPQYHWSTPLLTDEQKRIRRVAPLAKLGIIAGFFAFGMGLATNLASGTAFDWSAGRVSIGGLIAMIALTVYWRKISRQA
jgi:hypothetical protein